MTAPSQYEQSSVLILFGATGDLAMRMLWPSLYHLYCDNLLPKDFRIVGVARTTLTMAVFRKRVATALEKFATEPLRSTVLTAKFLDLIDYTAIAEGSTAEFEALKGVAKPDRNGSRLYYLSVPPSAFQSIVCGLGKAGLISSRDRVIIEKPIGHDLRSSKTINDTLSSAFSEEKIFRIDHYLGKETVQNLLALRFANSLFEPIWSANAIDHVQITVAETVGVGGRWAYYNEAGALRDMVQNHILQLLALIAMEPPSSLDPSAVRNEKVKVLNSLRPLSANDAADSVVPGQYAMGVSDGEKVPGFFEENDAEPCSNTESFIAIRAHIDNWRWKDVPFCLRTGKRMAERRTEIVVQFRDVPHNIFAAENKLLQPNRLVIALQPREEVTLELMNKKPGLDGVTLRPVALNLSLTETFKDERRRIAYERLLRDALHGNSTLFVRRDELEAAWTWVDGVKMAIDHAGIQCKPYPAGTWGPSSAFTLADKIGIVWNE